MRILVAEDEPAIAAAVRAALEREAHAVDVVPRGDEALAFADVYPYDLAILDVRMPGLDGLEVCGRLREARPAMPILMLTALDGIDDRVAGLDRGADDYLAKPFAMAELVARVRALLRRRAADRRPTIRVGDLDLDPATREVRRAGRTIRLSSREFALLEVLARRPNMVFSHERLIDAVWNADADAGANLVEVYIRSLRRKLDEGRRDGLIETIRGAGYRLRPTEGE